MRLILLVPVLISCFVLRAQQAVSSHDNGNDRILWRKRVVRHVRLHESWLYDTSKRALAWDDFFKRLVDAGTSGKTEVRDVDGGARLSPTLLKNIVATRFDTIIAVDSEGRESMHNVKLEFYYGWIAKLRLTEEWEYDLQTGQTRVQIINVSPQRDVYSENGEYRGTASLFSIRWGEFERFLNTEGAGKKDSVEAIIWRDYFRDKGIVTSGKSSHNGSQFNGEAVRRITLGADTCGVNDDPNLMSLWDTSSGQILYNDIRQGAIKAYRTSTGKETRLLPPGGSMPGNLLTMAELEDLVKGRTDTQVVTDPVTGTEVLKIIHRDFDFWSITGYYVAELWTFDAGKGLVTINYTWAAPKATIFNDNGGVSESSPMFWINYPDTRRSLKRYNEYMPTRNMEWQLWNDRFNERKRR